MELLKKEMILVTIALIFNGFDIITGIVQALKTDEKLNSSKLRDGLFKKVGFVFCYALAVLLNHTKSYFNFNFPVDLVPIICGYVVLTEIVSIIENICKINTDLVPEKIKNLIGLNND